MKDRGQEYKASEEEAEIDNEVVRKTDCCFDDLPDEVIEFVLSLVPPYKDLHQCMRVCKRWRNSVLNVVKVKRRKLFQALSLCEVKWQRDDRPLGCGPAITQRNSHAAAVHNNYMYVFGGCTNTMTTFNDLWCLELGSRNWERPRTTGQYPTPKACSSLVCHRNTLVLFGGWAFPCIFPFHQSHQLFSELHTYNIPEARWRSHSAADPVAVWPPPLAGHSASLHGNSMVVFGGLKKPEDSGVFHRTNDVWRLDLVTMCWEQMRTSSPRPRERYGHSQTALDKHHALIMGGAGRPNDRYSDVWLLIMKGRVWTWKQLPVLNLHWAPPDISRHPTCRVGQHIVVLNPQPGHVRWKPNVQPPPPPNLFHRRQPDRDVNVNGRRGELVPRINANPPAPALASPRVVMHERESGLVLAAFEPQRLPGPPPQKRERRLEMLRKMQQVIEEGGRMGRGIEPASEQKTNKNQVRRPLGLYIMDISEALNEEDGRVWWQEHRVRGQGPDETLLYTLVYGKAELIMFGGLQKDYEAASIREAANVQRNQDHLFIDPMDFTKVSTGLYFISAPPNII